jgi:hypothetical protein
MICPYDTRIVPATILACAQRTHPERVDGEHTSVCPDYADPAELEADPGDGLWLAGQLCDWTEIRSDEDSSVIRLHVASRHNEETAQPGVRYPI